MRARHRSPAMRLVLAVGRPVMRLLMRRRWSGVEHLPRTGGCLVVANHTTLLDPLVVALFLVRNGCPPRFLAKVSLFRLPVAGALLRACGQIPVHRNTAQAGDAYRDAVAAVRAGECVTIYPEGTLTHDPGLWPMRGKTGAARIALETGCPVVPVVHWGDHLVMPQGARAPRPWPRRTVEVVAGPPIDLSAYRDRPVDAETLREVTDLLQRTLTTHLAALRGVPAPPAPAPAGSRGADAVGGPGAPPPHHEETP